MLCWHGNCQRQRWLDLSCHTQTVGERLLWKVRITSSSAGKKEIFFTLYGYIYHVVFHLPVVSECHVQFTSHTPTTLCNTDVLQNMFWHKIGRRRKCPTTRNELKLVQWIFYEWSLSCAYSLSAENWFISIGLTSDIVLNFHILKIHLLMLNSLSSTGVFLTPLKMQTHFL